METSAEHHIPTISIELEAAYFDDVRLTERLKKIAKAIAEKPSASLPAIFEDKSGDLEGAYRFLRNKKVTMARVLAPHLDATCERLREEGTILVLHDTTEFAFEGEKPRSGLGPVPGGEGFFAHVALAITADERRRPLGVLGVEPLIREPKPKPAKKGAKAAKKTSWLEKYNDPNKESLRWSRVMEQVEARVDGGAEIIHVMDREADDYALLCLLSKRRFVIRLKHNRVITPDEPGSPARKVRDALAETPHIFERTVALSARNNDAKAPKVRRLYPTRNTRIATLRGGATRVTLVRPHGLPMTLPAELTLNVVHVEEVDVPTGETPVSWVLLTNEAVTTKEEIARVVDIYRARWVIEIDHPWCTPCDMTFISDRQPADLSGIAPTKAANFNSECTRVERSRDGIDRKVRGSGYAPELRSPTHRPRRVVRRPRSRSISAALARITQTL